MTSTELSDVRPGDVIRVLPIGNSRRTTVRVRRVQDASGGVVFGSRARVDADGSVAVTGNDAVFLIRRGAVDVIRRAD
jgi:hypothetical protein